MKTLVVQGVLLVFVAEFAVLIAGQRHYLPWAAGIAIAVPVLGIRRLLANNGQTPVPPAPIDEPGESLRRWLANTEARIRWAESTRSDWDRRWRPILAGGFEVSSGQRRSKDPAAFSAAGRMTFGDELWPWVDPGNVAAAGDRGPGPGRVVLEQILHRMEQP